MDDLTKDVSTSVDDQAIDGVIDDAQTDYSNDVIEGEVVEVTPAQESAAEQPEQAGKGKKKLPPALQKLWDWLQAHENIRQMVYFIGFSLICFAVEYITFTIINESCKAAGGAAVRPFEWFLFKYDEEAAGVGGFAAFLVSNIIAQICTFVLNRKKTFKATNNVVISGIMYAMLVVIIILLNTWLGGIITKAIAATAPDNKTIATIGGYVGKFAGSFLSFVINFVGCKFLVMRNWGKKKEVAAEEAAPAETDHDLGLEELADENSAMLEGGENTAQMLEGGEAEANGNLLESGAVNSQARLISVDRPAAEGDLAGCAAADTSDGDDK